MSNESTLDRGIRALLALLLLAVGTVAGGALRPTLWVLAGILGVTAAVGFCPLYRLLGINTRR